MANHMCPQDYVNLTRQFLTCNCRSLLPFTVDTVTKYCIKKTPELDPGDETIIRQIVTETLEMYRGKGCLKKLRNTYHVIIFSNTRISNVEGFVLEDPRPMGSISSEMIEKLNCKPNEIIFIDDKEKNVISAKNLGIHGIVYKKETIVANINSLLSQPIYNAKER